MVHLVGGSLPKGCHSAFGCRTSQLIEDRTVVANLSSDHCGVNRCFCLVVLTQAALERRLAQEHTASAESAACFHAVVALQLPVLWVVLCIVALGLFPGRI